MTIRQTNCIFFFGAVVLALVAVSTTTTRAFQPPLSSSLLPKSSTSITTSTTSTTSTTPASTSRLFSTSTPPKQEELETTTTTTTEKPKRKARYEPKWVKKATLAEQLGGGDESAAVDDFDKKGIKGSIPVLFKTLNSNVTKTTMALPGQPLRDVATQAGQFIKYGCGKGECGTCESMVNGKWIRPCIATVPVDFTVIPTTTTTTGGQQQQDDSMSYYVVTCKAVKNKGISSGKFYSVRSIFIGFWNNLLGMWGIVKYRQNAKKNWQDRQEYENLIRQRTKEIKQARLAAHAMKSNK